MELLDNISKHFQDEDWLQLLESLGLLTKEAQNEETFRYRHGAAIFKEVNQILPKLTQKLNVITDWYDNTTSVLLQTIKECFRTLRNVCVNSPANQDLIFVYPDIIVQVNTVFSVLTVVSDKNGVIEVLRIVTQFLGNLCVGNSKTQSEVLVKILPLMSDAIVKSQDLLLTNYVSMILHTCLVTKRNNVAAISLEADVYNIVSSILTLLTTEDLEWGLLVIEDVLFISEFLQKLDSRIKTKEWIFITEVMINVLKETELSNSQPIEISNLLFLANQIVNNSSELLSIGLQESPRQQNGWLLAKMIEVLGLATACLPDVYSGLQVYQPLLSISINLLRGIDEIGKTGRNGFTNVEKLSELNSVSTEHPVYGLKRDLIRLIANMVNKNKPNQNKVQELDGIPLLLDQSTMDGKNPYITQWVVLAIHNLCEDNAHNKAVISRLQLQGVANNEYVLNELGIETTVENDKVVIKKPKNS